jgi:hypothetical protein
MRRTRISTCLLLLALCLILPACTEDTARASESAAANSLASQPQTPEASPGEKIPIRILYVGLSDTARTKDFTTFLSRHFKDVASVDLYTFKEEQTQGSDVVILDKDGIQWLDRGGRPLMDFKVSHAYAKPTVSLGIPGAFWTRAMNLKTGYM